MAPTCVVSLAAIAVLGAMVAGAQEIRIPDLRGDDSPANMVFRLEDSAMELWRQGNPMRWAEISADDIIYIDPALTAPIVGIEAYSKYLKPLVGKVAYDASEYVHPRVALYGDTAVLTYNYHSLSKGNDGALHRTSFWNTTEVYRLIGGQWKIVHTHWSYINNEQPDTVDVPVPVHAEEQKPSGVAGELLALEITAMERWRKGDPYGFTDICAAGVTYFDTGTPARLDGLEALKGEYRKREGKIRYDVMDFIAPHVQSYRDSAVLYYRFFSTVLNPDGSVKSRKPWNCTEVFARIDGTWKIVHTHWSYIHGTRADSGI